MGIKCNRSGFEDKLIALLFFFLRQPHFVCFKPDLSALEVAFFSYLVFKRTATIISQKEHILTLYTGLVKYGRLDAIGDQYFLTGDYDFNFFDSIHFLNP